MADFLSQTKIISPKNIPNANRQASSSDLAHLFHMDQSVENSMTVKKYILCLKQNLKKLSMLARRSFKEEWSSSPTTGLVPGTAQHHNALDRSEAPLSSSPGQHSVGLCEHCHLLSKMSLQSHHASPLSQLVFDAGTETKRKKCQLTCLGLM